MKYQILSIGKEMNIIMKKSKLIIVTISIILITLLLISLFYSYRNRLHYIFIQSHFNRKLLINTIRQYKNLDIFLLLSLAILVNAVPGCPNSVIGIISGVCLGRWLGFLINVIGMVCGNVLSLIVISHFGISKSYSKKNKLINDIMHMKHPLIGLIIGYAVPMIPTVFTNYAATKFNLNWQQLLCCITIGSLPSAWLYACGGDAFLCGNNIVGIITLIAIVFLLFLVVIIHHDKKIETKI